MWLLKASVEAAVVTCQATLRSCLQDLLPERRHWQGPDWWCGKQLSGESLPASASRGAEDKETEAERLIWREGLDCKIYIYVYISIRKVLITSLSKESGKTFVETEALCYCMKWISLLRLCLIELFKQWIFSNKAQQWKQQAWRQVKLGGGATEWQSW